MLIQSNLMYLPAWLHNLGGKSGYITFRQHGWCGHGAHGGGIVGLVAIGLEFRVDNPIETIGCNWLKNADNIYIIIIVDEYQVHKFKK